MEQRGSEWTLMNQGGSSEASDPGAWALLDEIWGSVYDWNPSTEDEQALYSLGLDRVNDPADARRLRIDEAEERLPVILRALVGVGGIITVGFTYFFGLENALAHRVMVLALAVVLSLALLSLAILGLPFAGPAQLRPEAFELILERFETSELSTLR
jgi:hypothetical protein